MILNAHGEVTVEGSFICGVCVQYIIYSVYASVICIRGKTESNVMKSGYYPQGLTLLDMEMRVGEISQAP